ncbi:MAG: flagellar hook-associated protein 3 [Deltaproteobacteria bacterium]|nr:MAG: flagellar hook-associated protein 3 [Deltaproteobacteria bacterium]
MRVTHQTASASVINNMRRQSGQILKTQETIASGKRINRSSDDPRGMARILDMRQLLSTLNQYQRNTTQGELRIDTLETTLAAVDDFVAKARGIVAHANQNTDMQAALAGEVAKIREQVIQLANNRLGDTYLFAGHNTDTAPFLDDGTYTGDGGSYHIRVGQTSEMVLQVDGNTVFKDTEDIFLILENLQTALESSDSVQIQNQAAPLARIQEHLQAVRADIGGNKDQLEVSGNYLDKFILNMETYLADLEEADLTEAVLALQFQNTVYEAALVAAADLIQPSLLQFLR